MIRATCGMHLAISVVPHYFRVKRRPKARGDCRKKVKPQSQYRIVA
jgi:hypothetical protein